jgi:hypothetical protein
VDGGRLLFPQMDVWLRCYCVSPTKKSRTVRKTKENYVCAWGLTSVERGKSPFSLDNYLSWMAGFAPPPLASFKVTTERASSATGTFHGRGSFKVLFQCKKYKGSELGAKPVAYSSTNSRTKAEPLARK